MSAQFAPRHVRKTFAKAKVKITFIRLPDPPSALDEKARTRQRRSVRRAMARV